uniref:Uncharacterized protein n=1 Tax=Caenorhabditis japonica TaxID=281687 RepID=A0A8R1EBY2_CAEJA
MAYFLFLLLFSFRFSQCGEAVCERRGRVAARDAEWVKERASSHLLHITEIRGYGLTYYTCPDLNPMDFSVWGMLEGKIAGKVFATVDDLKAALEVAWASLDDGYLRRTVNSVKKRLRACVKARGSNFEILL